MNLVRIREGLVTTAIPLLTGVILGFLEIFGRDYITPIILIGLGIFIFLFLIYYAIKFLEDRENRWKRNKREHEKQFNRLNIMENDIKEIQSFIKTNEKINKLERRISYLEGSIRK